MYNLGLELAPCMLCNVQAEAPRPRRGGLGLARGAADHPHSQHTDDVTSLYPLAAD